MINMRIRVTPILLLIDLAIVASMLASASTIYAGSLGPHLIDSLPFRIQQRGTYRLALDLTYASPKGAAISVMANEVTLDLNGKTLFGSAGPSTGAVGISALDRQGITIKNGRVSGFYFGIDIQATDRDTRKSKKHNLVDVRLERNWYFGVRLVGSRSVIRDCVISDTGGSTRKQHTIPHGVRFVGENNVMRDNRICDLRLRHFPYGKGEIVAVHFDRAKNSVLDNNLIIELNRETDDPIPPDDKRERRFGVWVNGGPSHDTFLHVRDNVFRGFTVPLAFTPGTDGRVKDNVFYNADVAPIRGKPASQLADNIIQKSRVPPSEARTHPTSK